MDYQKFRFESTYYSRTDEAGVEQSSFNITLTVQFELHGKRHIHDWYYLWMPLSDQLVCPYYDAQDRPRWDTLFPTIPDIVTSAVKQYARDYKLAAVQFIADYNMALVGQIDKAREELANIEWQLHSRPGSVRERMNRLIEGLKVVKALDNARHLPKTKHLYVHTYSVSEIES